MPAIVIFLSMPAIVIFLSMACNHVKRKQHSRKTCEQETTEALSSHLPLPLQPLTLLLHTRHCCGRLRKSRLQELQPHALVIVDAPETNARGLSSHRPGSPCGALLMILMLSDGSQLVTLGHAIGSQQLSPLSCDRTCQRIKGRKINFGIIPNAAAAAASTTFVILSSCHCTPRPSDDVCVVRDAEPVRNRVKTKKKCDTLFSIELSSCV
jgi:hypothetical protein